MLEIILLLVQVRQCLKTCRPIVSLLEFHVKKLKTEKHLTNICKNEDALNNNHVFIIAEAGVNHNGDIKVAKQLIDIAAEAKADAVKFQTFKSENIVTKNAAKADYQKNNLKTEELDQLSMLKKLELTKEQHFELIDYCKVKNIKFLSTPFDLESADFLFEIGMDIFKIASGEITNLPLLEKIGSFSKKVILSTGMATINEIQDALSVIENAGTPRKNITILHCNTEYPTPMNDVNLLAMNTIHTKCNCSVGYSDHTMGVEVPIAATALGASVIEKHFTVSRSLEGPDHAASLEPQELSFMVQCIRNISQSLGSGEKKPSPSEVKNISLVRKSIFAKTPIKAGDIFNRENITVKRPGTGISPMLFNDLLGTTSKYDFEIDDQIRQ